MLTESPVRQAPDLLQTLALVETAYLRSVLDRVGQRLPEAARETGLSETALLAKMRHYGIKLSARPR